MARIHRAATATASAVETLFVIGCVIAMGVIGLSLGAMMSVFSQGQQSGGLAFFGFLIGAAVGFVLYSLVVSISMNLREIALSTRRLVELADGATPEQAATDTDTERLTTGKAAPQTGPRFQRFANASAELSERAKASLNRAKNEGYRVRLDASGSVVIMERSNEGEFHLISNGDIEDLAKEKGWI